MLFSGCFPKVFKSISLLSVQLFLQPTTPVPIKIALLSFQQFQRPTVSHTFPLLFSVTVHRSSESTFPPGPNGLGSPLNVDDALLSTAAVTIQLFNGTRCKLLKSIFHLHTLVRTSLSAECSTEQARWARNFRTVQRSAENCY